MSDKKKQAGVSLGALTGLIHSIWVGVVASGLGQPAINVLESGHFVSSNYTITAFDPMIALTGIILAVVFGYIIGWTFMYLYILTGKKLD